MKKIISTFLLAFLAMSVAKADEEMIKIYENYHPDTKETISRWYVNLDDINFDSHQGWFKIEILKGAASAYGQSEMRGLEGGTISTLFKAKCDTGQVQKLSMVFKDKKGHRMKVRPDKTWEYADPDSNLGAVYKILCYKPK